MGVRFVGRSSVSGLVGRGYAARVYFPDEFVGFKKLSPYDAGILERFPWVRPALGELGESEVSGSGNNSRIVEYHESTGIGRSDDSVPWCSSFMNWCLESVGLVGTGSPAARSWLRWGVPCSPVGGSIIVLWRGRRDGWQGHVGILVDYDAERERVWVLGGNVRDSVMVESYPLDRVIGIRCPKDAGSSTTIRAAKGGAAAGVGLGGVAVLSEVYSVLSAGKDVVRAARDPLLKFLGLGVPVVMMGLLCVLLFCLWWIWRERRLKLGLFGI